MYTPNIFLKGDDEADFIHAMTKLPLDKIMFINGCSISGMIFLAGGFALLAGGM